MNYLKNSFLFLFVGIALILSSCGKEDVSQTEDEIRTESLEELVLELDAITDYETDETEKGVCSGSVGYHDKHLEDNVSGQTRYTIKNFVGDITGNNTNKWYYWHIDVKTPAHNYKLKDSKIFYGNNTFTNKTVTVPYAPSQCSSRSYLYVWTGSTWCRLDVSYKF